MVVERFRNDTTTVYSEDADLVWERTYDAPRERAWKAFMDPERIPNWWGPDIDGVRDHVGVETFTFKYADGKTKLTSRSHFPTVEELEGALSTGMIKGGVESWDRFEAMLAEG